MGAFPCWSPMPVDQKRRVPVLSPSSPGTLSPLPGVYYLRPVRIPNRMPPIHPICPAPAYSAPAVALLDFLCQLPGWSLFVLLFGSEDEGTLVKGCVCAVCVCCVCACTDTTLCIRMLYLFGQISREWKSKTGEQETLLISIVEPKSET